MSKEYLSSVVKNNDVVYFQVMDDGKNAKFSWLQLQQFNANDMIVQMLYENCDEYDVDAFNSYFNDKMNFQGETYVAALSAGNLYLFERSRDHYNDMYRNVDNIFTPIQINGNFVEGYPGFIGCVMLPKRDDVKGVNEDAIFDSFVHGIANILKRNWGEKYPRVYFMNNEKTHFLDKEDMKRFYLEINRFAKSWPSDVFINYTPSWCIEKYVNENINETMTRPFFS